jgi:hypothetical protein
MLIPDSRSPIPPVTYPAPIPFPLPTFRHWRADSHGIRAPPSHGIRLPYEPVSTQILEQGISRYGWLGGNGSGDDGCWD